MAWFFCEQRLEDLPCFQVVAIHRFYDQTQNRRVKARNRRVYILRNCTRLASIEFELVKSDTNHRKMGIKARRCVVLKIELTDMIELRQGMQKSIVLYLSKLWCLYYFLLFFFIYLTLYTFYYEGTDTLMMSL